MVEIMEFLTQAAENWEVVAAGFIIFLASFGKVIEVAISTMKNIRDAWYSAFPNGKQENPTVKIDWSE